jgi:hypothetical protein
VSTLHLLSLGLICHWRGLSLPVIFLVDTAYSRSYLVSYRISLETSVDGGSFVASGWRAALPARPLEHVGAESCLGFKFVALRSQTRSRAVVDSLVPSSLMVVPPSMPL